MNLEQALRAKRGLDELAQKEMDYESAYKINLLRKKLEVHTEFYLSEEMHLVQKYGRKNSRGAVEWDEHGIFEFTDAESGEAYRREHRNLEAVELEPIEGIRIHPPARIRPAVLEALAGLVEMEETK